MRETVRQAIARAEKSHVSSIGSLKLLESRTVTLAFPAGERIFR